MPTSSEEYLARCREIIDAVAAQRDDIAQAADWFAASILAGRLVHLFGSGHSRIAVEEMWPRYGSFPGFHPIVELSLTYHNSVVGSGGQRQAMYLENASGLAERILRNYDLHPEDAAMVVSSSGCNTVPIEMAELFTRRDIKTVALVSKAHSEATTSQHPSGKRLSDVANLVLDTAAPAGDAMVHLAGLDTPVAPGSTVGACVIVNAIKAEVAERLVAAGAPPQVLTASCIVGKERSAELFDAAYDRHAHLLAKLYENVGCDPRTKS